MTILYRIYDINIFIIFVISYNFTTLYDITKRRIYCFSLDTKKNFTKLLHYVFLAVQNHITSCVIDYIKSLYQVNLMVENHITLRASKEIVH